MKTTKGQSSGCIITPAAWAQLTWKAVGQRPWEHCTQQPAALFLRFLQKTHFYNMGNKLMTLGTHGTVPSTVPLPKHRAKPAGVHLLPKQESTHTLSESPV